MRFVVLILLLGCPAATTPAATIPAATTPPPAVAPAPTTQCRVEQREVQVEWTLDAAGFPTKQYVNNDAAAHQFATEWVRDRDGRTLRVETEMLEGIGEDRHFTRTLTHRESNRTVEVRYEERGEVHSERYFYDDRGRPIRIESVVGDGEPRITSCRYDDRGRVVMRDGVMYEYVGDRTMPSHARYDAFERAPFVAVGDAVFEGDPLEPYRHNAEIQRYLGDCTDVFFYPCSPVFAPPPAAGDTRGVRLPRFERRPAASMEAVVEQSLGCRNNGASGEDAPDETASDDDDWVDLGAVRCTVESVQTAVGTGRVRGVALVTIARGEEAEESTHLLLHLEDGWSLGPEVADGPFNGNQTVGTLRFAVSRVALQPVLSPTELGLVAHYETETNVAVDGAERAIRESGLILCTGLASAMLQCTRVAESIHEQVGDQVTEASARLRIVGDGTIAVDQVSGRHQRVPADTFVVEDWFE